MLITVEIPDEAALKLGVRESVSRELLEAYAAQAYRTGKISRHQAGLLLGLDRWKTEDFLAAHDAIRPYGANDAVHDGAEPDRE